MVCKANEKNFAGMGNLEGRSEGKEGMSAGVLAGAIGQLRDFDMWAFGFGRLLPLLLCSRHI
jgi:hypothetical protein